MKRSFFALALIIAGVLGSAFVPKGGIEVGDQAPLTDYEMLDVSQDKETSLEDLAGEKGLLVVFSCNTCPFVIGWEDRYNDLAELAQKKGINMVLVNSNEAKRDGDDSEEAMREKHESSKYTMPYLVDENSKLAIAFGATVTPQAYLFNSEMELVYTGLIDDNMRDRKKAKAYLFDSIENLSKGKEIDPAKTNAKGCSIKKV